MFFFRINPAALGAPLGALIILWVFIIVILPIFALCYLYTLFVKFIKTSLNLSTIKSILLTLVCLFFAFNAFHYIEAIAGGKKEYKRGHFINVKKDSKLFFSFIKEKK